MSKISFILRIDFLPKLNTELQSALEGTWCDVLSVPGELTRVVVVRSNPIPCAINFMSNRFQINQVLMNVDVTREG